MKDMLISVLKVMKGNRGSIKQIKNHMISKFRDRLLCNYTGALSTKADSNLQQWEKTILKTIARYKNIFLKQKAVFSLNTCNGSSLMNSENETSRSIEKLVSKEEHYENDDSSSGIDLLDMDVPPY